MSRGAEESKALLKKIRKQVNRLMTQLEDLEEFRNELDEEDYEETKADTMTQLEQFQRFLSSATQGDMTLVDKTNAIQLAIRAAISSAFQTPEVIRMFAAKQPDLLREKLAQLERDFKLLKMTEEIYRNQKSEILAALKTLGEELSSKQKKFLQSHARAALVELQEDELAGNLMGAAAGQIRREQK